MKNDMMEIKRAMEMKNAQMSQMGAAKAPAAGNGMAELKRIATDSNADASPQKNAADIDKIAEIVGTRFEEFDQVMRIVMGKVDEMYQEHQQIMAALKGAQTPPTTPPQPVPAVNPVQGV